MEMQEEGIRKAERQEVRYQLRDHLVCNVGQVSPQSQDDGETIKGLQPMTQSTLCWQICERKFQGGLRRCGETK